MKPSLHKPFFNTGYRVHWRTTKRAGTGVIVRLASGKRGGTFLVLDDATRKTVSIRRTHLQRRDSMEHPGDG